MVADFYCLKAIESKSVDLGIRDILVSLKLDPWELTYQTNAFTGLILAGKSYYPQAQDMAVWETREHPKDPKAWEDLGLSSLAIKDYNLSYSAYKEAEKLDPTMPYYKRMLGIFKVKK